MGNNLTEEAIKFLRIYFVEYLTWKNHLKYVNNIISSSLFMINQVKHILQKYSFEIILFYDRAKY